MKQVFHISNKLITQRWTNKQHYKNASDCDYIAAPASIIQKKGNTHYHFFKYAHDFVRLWVIQTGRMTRGSSYTVTAPNGGGGYPSAQNPQGNYPGYNNYAYQQQSSHHRGSQGT